MSGEELGFQLFPTAVDLAEAFEQGRKEWGPQASRATPTAFGFLMAAEVVLAHFEQRGKGKDWEVRFLASWLPAEDLLKALEACMTHHGDPGRWWDGLDQFLPGSGQAEV